MEDELKLRFIESLQRNNDQIREDRAKIIGAYSELIYRRRVDYNLLNYTLKLDAAYVFPTKKNLVVTCLDQIDEKFKVENLDVEFDVAYGSYSQYSKDFK
ncbi:hypothetical protein HNP24_003602 [Chryseobacterium sediminis]|uniref:Uncharacterized protein n=1 Tax=Chryseobacterium sediminis TaxID=1679494 RepID=A0ABR6Q3U9_9FLAO|nr:hypothetical protein [Chryseobacterium sediminis]MBB6332610.1 hypothetical protein [Chryseobacterium sediminis]